MSNYEQADHALALLIGDVIDMNENDELSDLDMRDGEMEVEDEEEQESDEELDANMEAITHIEDMVLDFLKQLHRALPTIPPASSQSQSQVQSQLGTQTPAKRKARIDIELADRRKMTTDGLCGKRTMSYPRNTKGPSSKPFAQLFKALDLTHEALVNGIPATKRDMYYKDVPLFKSQSVVDRLVDDLAATFSLDRSDLNIRATSKGLICGSGIVMRLGTGETVNANDTEGALIPVGEDIESFGLDPEVSWVLVVEKDAVFQTLCHLRLTDHPLLPGRGLIITGKGYPDLATRQLVKTLSDNLPRSVPLLALVDADAYGIDILSVYKFGSQGLRHENLKLAAERVEWVGVLASELAQLNIDRDALIPITDHDAKKALSMLRRPRNVMPPKWRKELMHMLHNRRKAEIEIISSFSSSPRIATDVSSSMSRSEASSVQPSGSDSVATSNHPLLLQYLATKISACVLSAVALDAVGT